MRTFHGNDGQSESSLARMCQCLHTSEIVLLSSICEMYDRIRSCNSSGINRKGPFVCRLDICTPVEHIVRTSDLSDRMRYRHLNEIHQRPPYGWRHLVLFHKEWVFTAFHDLIEVKLCTWKIGIWSSRITTGSSSGITSSSSWGIRAKAVDSIE